MTDTVKESAVDIDFDKLNPRQQEAYIARGDYKDPSKLDQGNAPKNAPDGPVPYDDDSVGDPDTLDAEAVSTRKARKAPAAKKRA